MKTVNDYKGLTDNEMIDEAIKNRENGIVIIPPRKSDIEPERDYWLLDRAILLPSDTTIILQNCKIKLSDKCRDNFFRSANCGFGFNENETLRNIHIKGMGLCVLEGADHPRATGDGGKIIACPCPKTNEDIIKYADWIPEDRRQSGELTFFDTHSHSYGTDAGNENESQKGDWRGIGILFACVENFSIENLKIVEPHGWAISFENCAYGSVEKIEFNARMSKMIDGMLSNTENQDGIDLRNGCHDIIISDITGETGDDIIALTAIACSKREYIHGGSLCTTHVMHNDWSKRETDIYNVIIRNVKGCPRGGCAHVRLLSTECHIKNVIIDGILDTSPDGFRNWTSVLIGDIDNSYGKNLPDGISNVTISNIISKSQWPIDVVGFLKDSVISNVVNCNPEQKAVNVRRENGLDNVIINNICETGVNL